MTLLFSDLSDHILTFWFGEPGSAVYNKPQTFWFQSTPELDHQIQHLFEPFYLQALQGEHDTLKETAEGCLALILMMDQFPRNMYRGTPQAFASDHHALACAEQALAKGFDQQLASLQRLFLYLPFEHSEGLHDQERCIKLFEALGNKEALDYAYQHHAIIKRFGRFPHRNKILDRPSTPEEIEFLKQKGSSF